MLNLDQATMDEILAGRRVFDKYVFNPTNMDGNTIYYQLALYFNGKAKKVDLPPITFYEALPPHEKGSHPSLDDLERNKVIHGITDQLNKCFRALLDLAMQESNGFTNTEFWQIPEEAEADDIGLKRIMDQSRECDCAILRKKVQENGGDCWWEEKMWQGVADNAEDDGIKRQALKNKEMVRVRQAEIRVNLEAVKQQ